MLETLPSGAGSALRHGDWCAIKEVGRDDENPDPTPHGPGFVRLGLPRRLKGFWYYVGTGNVVGFSIHLGSLDLTSIQQNC
jgi:hypothetical protein